MKHPLQDGTESLAHATRRNHSIFRLPSGSIAKLFTRGRPRKLDCSASPALDPCRGIDVNLPGVSDGRSLQGIQPRVGKLKFTAKDDTFKETGKIGLWTKADWVIRFDDLTVEERSNGTM